MRTMEMCVENDAKLIAALRHQVEAARSLILHACDIMTTEQVGQWAGVRSWLEQDENDYEPLYEPKEG